ncbi:hypothetical protein [Alicyclobacillus sp. SO9]|uniref:hypothetical protein n=1 Tax=Alicyclobacillus sp. SO9 TaxID=2665646 RepID=UPI001E33DFDD|nr:hypothetical protein [Alicyclobacillus sp. SO9]
MNEFLQVGVPGSFAVSVRKGVVRRLEQLSCLAPWCDGHQSPGTLVKTGTTLKRRKSGKTLFYYLACTECGCEYAINEDGQLEERTYFIEGYQALTGTNTSLNGMKGLARSIGFTEEKTRRCLAYFCTRVELDQWSESLVVDSSLLERVFAAVCHGTTWKTIQQWDCWDSYQQFLVYRFHPQVMRALIGLKRPRPWKRSDGIVKREKVREVLDEFMKNDRDITIAAVCNTVGVCAETIRNWGDNDLIAEAKKFQWEQRTQRRKDEIYQKIENYLSQNLTTILTSGSLYNIIETSRTVLWRIAPEITAYIHERMVEHNRNIKEMTE